MDTLALKIIKDLRDLVVQNSNLTNEQLSLLIIQYFIDLYVTSDVIFRCESGLSHETLRELHQFLKASRAVLFQSDVNSEDIVSKKSFALFADLMDTSQHTKH